MTDSLQELKAHPYRKNVSSIHITLQGPGKDDKSTLYHIPFYDPDDSAAYLENLLAQLMESAAVRAEVSSSVYLPNGQTVGSVHPESECEGQGCAIHHPSDHFMKNWSQEYDTNKGFMRRKCPEHKMGHVDFDELVWYSKKEAGPDLTQEDIHCCKCCRPGRKEKDREQEKS